MEKEIQKLIKQVELLRAEIQELKGSKKEEYVTMEKFAELRGLKYSTVRTRAAKGMYISKWEGKHRLIKL